MHNVHHRHTYVPRYVQTYTQHCSCNPATYQQGIAAIRSLGWEVKGQWREEETVAGHHQNQWSLLKVFLQFTAIKGTTTLPQVGPSTRPQLSTPHHKHSYPFPLHPTQWWGWEISVQWGQGWSSEWHCVPGTALDTGLLQWGLYKNCTYVRA